MLSHITKPTPIKSDDLHSIYHAWHSKYSAHACDKQCGFIPYIYVYKRGVKWCASLFRRTFMQTQTPNSIELSKQLRAVCSKEYRASPLDFWHLNFARQRYSYDVFIYACVCGSHFSFHYWCLIMVWCLMMCVSLILHARKSRYVYYIENTYLHCIILGRHLLMNNVFCMLLFCKWKVWVYISCWVSKECITNNLYGWLLCVLGIWSIDLDGHTVYTNATKEIPKSIQTYEALVIIGMTTDNVCEYFRPTISLISAGLAHFRRL